MKTTITRILGVCLILGTQQFTLSAQNTLPCIKDTLYQALNFWLGDWDVFDANNNQVGQNRIEQILNGCAVMEHWTSQGGSEGKSLFFVDTNTQKWKQVWVTQSANTPGGQKEKTLVLNEPGQKTIFQGQYQVRGRTILDRTILTKQPDGSVKQEIQISPDQGQNWRTTFLGIYKPKK